MPHIIVEHSDGLSVDIPKLLSDLHDDLATRDTIDVHGVKTRSLPVHNAIVGNGGDTDKLIHVTLRLMPGRSDDLKKEMAQGLFAIARQSTRDDRISVTVEVAELHAESYTK